MVAQLSQGEISVNAAGTGIDQRKPMTVSTMAGTQMHVQQLIARVAMALAIFPEPLLYGAHGAESYAGTHF